MGRGGNQASLFTDIISDMRLKKALVIITNRPAAVGSLSRIDHKVEILGFTEQQVKQCVNHFFMDHPNKSEIVCQFFCELDNLPHLSKIIFVPMHKLVVHCTLCV